MSRKHENVLVTGGAGFMGAHVAQDLIREGYAVTVLDDLSGGFVENVPTDAEFIEGSILNAKLVDELFHQRKFKHVFHMAAYAAEGLSHFIKRFNYENNLIGTINLINASINCEVQCFVFTSSIAVYGKSQMPVSEDLSPVPEDPYGIAKFAVEQELRVCRDMFGLNFIIFRPHNVYGELQNIWDPYRNVLGIFMNEIMQEKEMTLFGDGSQTRAFSYIGDVTPVIAGSIARPQCYNQVFNIGSDEPVSVLELARRIAREFETEPKLRFLPERNEVKHAYASHAKIERYFNYKARVDLDEGIGKMARWARQMGPRAGKPFSNIEVAKNIPVSWRKLAAN